MADLVKVGGGESHAAGKEAEERADPERRTERAVAALALAEPVVDWLCPNE